ncbi:MAG: hypothetical protein U1C49_02230 [Candidatus Andersenbacteria bacterium]|nr:hypothetical protein [bacterium]MDZ4225645.1 hypothetical protein [Candidatus Andersenbacteria bacterium]
MPWQSLGTLFENKDAGSDEVDIKYLVQNYLRTCLKSEAIYCDSVTGGVAEVRVGSPGLAQEVILREYDLVEYLEKEAGYKLTKVKVRSSY